MISGYDVMSKLCKYVDVIHEVKIHNLAVFNVQL